MKQKTAVDLIIKEINYAKELSSPIYHGVLNALITVAENIKATTEKQQIEEAFSRASNPIDGKAAIKFWASDYYQQKYGDEPIIKND